MKNISDNTSALNINYNSNTLETETSIIVNETDRKVIISRNQSITDINNINETVNEILNENSKDATDSL